MGSIVIKNYYMTFETLKLGIFDTLKLWNPETKKVSNQGIFDFQLRESPNPSTYRLPPLHPPALLEDTRELGGHESIFPSSANWLMYSAEKSNIILIINLIIL